MEKYAPERGKATGSAEVSLGHEPDVYVSQNGRSFSPIFLFCVITFMV